MIFFQQDIDENTKLGIWQIDEDENFFLSKVPLQREITHPNKSLQHLAGRYLLKYLFKDFPLELIKIADTRKPFLENEQYHFSISHCGKYAAAIVSKTERVGIDIELYSPKVEKIKHKFLSEEELEMVNGEWSMVNEGFYHLSSIIYHLTLLWSCKEAVFKWWSYGNVDFSEKIKLQPFELQPSGDLNANFLSEKIFELKLHYQLFDDLCLVWVKTTPS